MESPAPRAEAHLDRLLKLVEQERDAEREAHEERLRALGPVARAVDGTALVDLEQVEAGTTLDGRPLVALERVDGLALDAAPRLAAGDAVELRARHGESDDVASGVVVGRTARRLEVALDRPAPPFLSEERLVVDRAPDDATWARACYALVELRTERQRGVAARRRAVLLGEQPPTFLAVAPPLPTRDAGGPALDPSQRAAVDRALAAEDLLVVTGGAGSGKSAVLVEVAARAAARGERVLLAAPSSAGVDRLVELCLDRGLQPVRVGARSQRDPRLAARSVEALAGARGAGGDADAVRAVLAEASVVCATPAAAAAELFGQRYDLALVDDAGQVTEPVALIVVALARRAALLAADPDALGPPLRSAAAAAAGLGVTLSERLVARHGDAIRAPLDHQHRLPRAIAAALPPVAALASAGADVDVDARALAPLLRRAIDAPPLLFLDTAGKGFEDEAGEAGVGRRNLGEAELIVERLAELLDAGLAPRDVAVIALDAPQADQVSRRASERGLSSDVEIGTPAPFVGREKEAVLVSLVRANVIGELGPLADERRLYLAFTRARRHLFVVGDSATIARQPLLARLLEAAHAGGGYRSAWSWPEP